MKADRRPTTFLLGVGAQKAGTTWVHHYLARSPQFVRGYRKEYHVFDSSDLADDPWLGRNLDMAQAELDKLRSGEPADPVHLHRAAMIADPKFYFDYFAGLLHSRPRFRATADVTPEYAALPAERLASIRDGFATRGVRTVALFLMRDPVDRIWSQIRMQEGRRPARFPASADKMVERLFDDPRYEQFSRYEVTMRNLESVWGDDEIHYGLYEQLFCEEGVRAICDLVGIAFRAPDFEKKSNVSSGKAVSALPDDVVRRVATHFADTYRAAAARFPDADLAELWPSSRFVL
ncbi:sulfotransferase [Nocardioides sp. URHA0032]|uniref:sulfotransferase n=1 Tax=Nocardioides sp. URHA0032 TaxID=1380388 RepID=UPI000687A8D8|nr:sulfotransferase [Nocardioides sp. URHA0032]